MSGFRREMGKMSMIFVRRYLKLISVKQGMGKKKNVQCGKKKLNPYLPIEKCFFFLNYETDGVSYRLIRLCYYLTWHHLVKELVSFENELLYKSTYSAPTPVKK